MTFGLDPGKCMVVPYGTIHLKRPEPQEKSNASAWLHKTYRIPDGKKILLFNGTLDYAPNATALERIILQILPLLGDAYHIIACGRIEDKRYDRLLKLSAPNYTFAGFVDDIRTYFLGADVFIHPVHLGGGVRTKVVEALSLGLPVVSYRSGAAGIRTELAGAMLSLVDDMDDAAFADAVRSIDYTAILPDAFYTYYDWDRITGSVADRIRQLQAE